MKKSYLVNTPSRDYGAYPKHRKERTLTPYGLASIATYCRKNGDDVILIDAENFGLSHADIIGQISDGELIGLNVTTPNFEQVASLAQKIFNATNARIVFGGTHATLDPKSILDKFPDSFVVVGDGEIAFHQIYSGDDISNIPGIAILDAITKRVIYPHSEVAAINNLDDLPWVERSLIKNEPYIANGGKLTMSFLTSRGCVGDCSFCITPAQYEVMKKGGAKKIRLRSISDVVREIDSIRGMFTVAQFIDDGIFPNAKRAEDFIKCWEANRLDVDHEFRCLLRPDQVVDFYSSGILEELFACGLKNLSLGIETGHERGRKMISSNRGGVDKKYSPEIQINAIIACNEVGIRTKGFFMIGLPNETENEVNQTIEYMNTLGDIGLNEVAVFPFKAYPHTRLYDYAIDSGFTHDELHRYMMPSVQNFIEVGINPLDASRDGFVNSVQLSEIPVVELHRLCQQSMHEFYKR